MMTLRTAAAIAVACLPGVAFAAPFGEEVPAIEDARAVFDADRLAVEITTTLPVFREDVRAKIDGRNVVIYVNGAQVDGKRVFGEGATAVRGYPRTSYAKLEIAMPSGLACSGPSTVAIEESTVHVSLGCKTAAAVAAAPVAAKAAAELPRAEPPRADTRPAPERVLAAKPPAPAPAAKSAAEAAASEKLRLERQMAELEAAAKEAAALSAAGEKETAQAEAKPGKDAPKAADQKPVAGPRPAESKSPLLVGGALFVLAGATFFLWRRRRERAQGLIRILETASLGPKRTLVVAEVDGEKMILGTSEAGISVLTPASRLNPWGEQTSATRVQLVPAFADGSAVVGSVTAAPAMAMATATAGAAPAPVHVHMPDENEGGLLSRLFRRNAAPGRDSGEDEGLGNMEDEFRDLLQDSIEDEELRRRLQAGLGGRTS